MEDNRDRPTDPSPQPRRFVYRSADPDASLAHPLRRATDIPGPFRASPGEICPNIQTLQFRVHLKVN